MTAGDWRVVVVAGGFWGLVAGVLLPLHLASLLTGAAEGAMFWVYGGLAAGGAAATAASIARSVLTRDRPWAGWIAAWLVVGLAAAMAAVVIGVLVFLGAPVARAVMADADLAPWLDAREIALLGVVSLIAGVTFAIPEALVLSVASLPLLWLLRRWVSSVRPSSGTRSDTLGSNSTTSSSTTRGTSSNS